MDRSVIDDLIAELEEMVAKFRGGAGNDLIISSLEAQIANLRKQYTEE